MEYELGFGNVRHEHWLGKLLLQKKCGTIIKGKGTIAKMQSKLQTLINYALLCK